MSARDKTYRVLTRLDRAGINATFDQAETLRRAELTLQRWSESECGDGSNWYTERDEKTGKTYKVHIESGRRYPTPDRERGALRRVAAVCESLGLHYYHQTDPRGCQLYVGRESLTDQNYSTTGVACCE